MDSKELRIGNYVLLEGMECEVSALDITDITLTNHPAYENEVFSLMGNGVTGIPLTEEWLLKFGFRIGKSEEYYELEFFEMFGYDNGDWAFRYLNNLIKLNLKYVHQLQNLYHALTGEELKIKDHGIS